MIKPGRMSIAFITIIACLVLSLGSANAEKKQSPRSMDISYAVDMLFNDSTSYEFASKKLEYYGSPYYEGSMFKGQFENMDIKAMYHFKRTMAVQISFYGHDSDGYDVFKDVISLMRNKLMAEGQYINRLKSEGCELYVWVINPVCGITVRRYPKIDLITVSLNEHAIF